MHGSRYRPFTLLSWMLAGTPLTTSVRAQQPAPPPPMPGPTMAEALEVARAAATKIGVNPSCAVVDARGDLIALTRMDGARFFTTDIARGKAQVSAMFGQPSGNLAQFDA